MGCTRRSNAAAEQKQGLLRGVRDVGFGAVVRDLVDEGKVLVRDLNPTKAQHAPIRPRERAQQHRMVNLPHRRRYNSTTVTHANTRRQSGEQWSQ